jgi:hypothetical protein
MTKDQLVEKVLHYNDEAPREILYSMTKAELQEYVETLRETFPQLRATEP